MSKLLLFSFITFISSCNAQVNTKTTDSPFNSINVPVVQRSRPVKVVPNFDTTLVGQYIRSIFQDSKGNLWFGTLEEGVVRYDTKSLNYFSEADGFKTTSVHSITEDKQGNIWLGTEDQGVYKYDGKQFRNYNEKNGLSSVSISRKSMLVDRSGVLWIGTRNGIFRYDPAADSTGSQCFSLFGLIPLVNIKGVIEDKKGNLWFASSNKGVFRYDGKTITNFTEKERLGDNYAGGMAEDRSGNIWFLMQGGICKYDGKTFTEFTPKDGLGGTDFWGIYIETSGIIWITARGSTTRFDPSVPIPNPKAFTVFTEKDGINCCVQSMYQDRSGNMWWGAGQGLFRFNGSRFYQVKQNGPW